MHQPDPLFMTVSEAAEYLNLNEYHIRRMMDSNEIQSIKVGRLRRIPVADLRRWATEETERQNGQTQEQQRGQHLQAG